MQLNELISDPDDLLALEPEEFAGVVLQYIADPDNKSQRNRRNISLQHTVREYAREKQELILRALMEAWAWLEQEGMVAPVPGDDAQWVFITRRGQQMTSPEKLVAYRRSKLLPRAMLHPWMAQKVWAAFLRGDYDTAVFQAFKEVEVRVRTASNLPDTEIGVNLMRTAFHKDTGVLSDSSAPVAEREALSALFSGAIGSYKNPQSHRHVPIEPREAVEMITLASHLLGIVERRSAS